MKAGESQASSLDISTVGSTAYLKSDNHRTSFKRARRTLLEKVLLVALFLALVAVVVLVVVVVNKDTAEAGGSAPDVCLTSDCAHAAARVLDSIDPSADPCDDFYQYACGGWKRKNIIPEDKSSQNVFGILQDEVQVINKYLLEDNTTFLDVTGVQKAKTLYESCVDTDLIEKLDSNVTVPLLEELGGWPVLGSRPGGNWVEADYNLSSLLVTLRTYNNMPLVRLSVGADSKDTERYILYVDQPYFGMPGRDYYLEDSLASMRQAYLTFATSVAELLGADRATAETDMADMLMLETDIANITMKAEDRRDSEALYNKMTIKELIQNFTEPSDIQFQWLSYFRAIFERKEVNVTIDETESVVVYAVPYFQKLFQVLQKYDKRTVANYIVWTIMMNRVDNLSERFRALRLQYNKVLYGTSVSRARWRSCVTYVNSHMGMALGHMFIKETFDETAKSVALEMIGNLRSSFDELLNEITWMDDNTRVLAKDKATAIKSWIGYPDNIVSPADLDKLYENVTFTRDGYFQNVLHNLNRRAFEGLAKLRTKYDKNIWTTPPATVNAYYSSVVNAIMFPAGILQPPFYEKNQPKSMNFGGIGVVIGHEITHGFDDRGRQYDKNGNLNQWWEQKIIDNFKQKAQCLVDQYSQYTFPEAGMNINGINTQGENIADNGGLKQSYRAYRRWVEKQGREEPMLPGLNLTHNQLFFVNFAQIWCNNIRPGAAIQSIKTGVHSPGEFRVKGTLQNSPDFARAFSCPSSSSMNPPNKCSVW